MTRLRPVSVALDASSNDIVQDPQFLSVIDRNPLHGEPSGIMRDYFIGIPGKEAGVPKDTTN